MQEKEKYVQCKKKRVIIIGKGASLLIITLDVELQKFK